MGFSEWKEITFQESGLGIEDGDRGTNYPNKSQLLKEGYCPFLNNKNIIGDKLNFEEVDFITKEKDELLRKGKAYHGDIILTTRGSVGNVALFHENIKYNFVRINSGMVIIKNNELFDLKFLYQQLKSPYMKFQYKSMATGSAQPQLPIKDIRKLKLLLPPLEEQKIIANILSTLDEKIETNNQINKKLEEMTQAIFKQWFVDFEFPNEDGEPYKSSGGEMVESELGMIPKGWITTPLYDLAEYINGTSFKKDEISEKKGLPIIKIAELKQGITDSTKYCICDKPEKYYLKNGDILFSWSGNPETSIDTFIWYREDGILNQHIFKVTSTLYSNEFIYLVLKYFKPIFMQIASNKQTTGLGHVTVSDLKRLKIGLPNQEFIGKFTSIVGPIVKKIHSNDLENNKLKCIRDYLLPKLISGEIRVPIE